MKKIIIFLFVILMNCNRQPQETVVPVIEPQQNLAATEQLTPIDQYRECVQQYPPSLCERQTGVRMYNDNGNNLFTYMGMYYLMSGGGYGNHVYYHSFGYTRPNTTIIINTQRGLQNGTIQRQTTSRLPSVSRPSSSGPRFSSGSSSKPSTSSGPRFSSGSGSTTSRPSSTRSSGGLFSSGSSRSSGSGYTTGSPRSSGSSFSSGSSRSSSGSFSSGSRSSGSHFSSGGHR